MVVWPDGYKFWDNYISDLGMLVTFLDIPNPVSSSLLTAAFIVHSLGSALFFLLLSACLSVDLPENYKKTVKTLSNDSSYMPNNGLYARMKRNVIIHMEKYMNDWTIYGLICGILSAVFIHGVYIFPKYIASPEYVLINNLHGLFAWLYFFCAALAMFFYVVVIYYRFPKFRWGLFPVILFIAGFVIYQVLPYVFMGLGSTSYPPTMQKIVVMLLIFNIISYMILCEKQYKSNFQ